MNLDDFEHFETLAKTRRSCRHYKPDALPDGMLERLLDVAHWAPSGYNLQPTHYVVVEDTEIKTKLRIACMDQPQITEAPAVIVFVGDRDVRCNHFEQILQLDKTAGAINEDYETKLRTYVPLAFDTGPLGWRWLWKCFSPILSFFIPIPGLPAVQRRYWLAKQVMLTAMNFMLAAHAAGLATVPMEGFDERRVKSLLKIPKRHVVPIIIPVGYAVDDTAVKTRIPIAQLTHNTMW